MKGIAAPGGRAGTPEISGTRLAQNRADLLQVPVNNNASSFF